MNLTIANTTIRQDISGRFCLNDLHKAAGAHLKHRPSRWLDNQQTKELFEEISIAGIPAIETKQKVGTFACREAVYAYATWISPAFFLKVIRTYDALATGYPTPPAVRPGQVEALQAERQAAVITPVSLQAMLDKPMQITVREYLALTQGKPAQALPQAEHAHGQHYSEEVRAEVLDLGDKGWLPSEIADRTGIQLDTVKTMLFRARKAGKIARGPRQGTKVRDAKGGAA